MELVAFSPGTVTLTLRAEDTPAFDLSAPAGPTVSLSSPNTQLVLEVGVPGSTGSAATVAVGSTTTLAAGSLATVANVGTAYAAVFNFGIPRGSDGAPGTSGIVYATSPLAYNSGTQTISIDLSGYATQAWVDSQGYLQAGALTGYALQSWVTSGFYPLASNPAGYLTSASLSGYATQSWVTSQGYLTTASASSTYQTISGMSAYLTISSASSTYAPLARGIPSGGATGQVLAKSSSSDYAASWQTPAVGDKYYSSSSTSLSVSNGTKTLTIATGLSYTTQQDIVIAYNASNHMHAVVTSYNSSTGVLVADVQQHTGSGTYSTWVVNVGGISSVAEWGLITGTILNQTDLQAALDARPLLTQVQTDFVAKVGYSPITVSDSFDNQITISGSSVIAQNNSATSSTQLNYLGITFPDSTTQTTAAVSGISDAPSDGTPYVRKDGAWEQLNIT